MRRVPTKERLAELDKVICLCSNCHRELHSTQWRACLSDKEEVQ